MRVPLILGFSDEDMVGTIQPHEDALVVTLRIGEYDVRRVMVDQGSVVDVMYPDLYKGLGLNPEDLTTYNSPLVSFEGRMVAPKGLIRLYGCGGGGLYCHRCFFSVHDYYGQTLASHP